MLEWFQTIGDVFVVLGNFIVTFFKNAIEMITLLFKAFSYVETVLLFLPIQYRGPLLALISFSLIITILHFGE